MLIDIQKIRVTRLRLALGLILINCPSYCLASMTVVSDDADKQGQGRTPTTQISQSYNKGKDDGISTQPMSSPSHKFHDIGPLLAALENIPVDSWRYFFTLMTDYLANHIRQQGFTNQFMLPHPSRLQIPGYRVDFDRIKWVNDCNVDTIPRYIWHQLTSCFSKTKQISEGDTNTIPSYIWYSLINRVDKFPYPYDIYTYLDQTRVHTISYNHNMTDQEVYALSRALYGTRIHTIGLRGETCSMNLYTRISARGVQALAVLTNLTSLDIGTNNIREAGAQSLAILINLTSLDVRSNTIRDAGAQALTTLTNLTSLTIKDNNIGDAGARSLATLIGLTFLDVGLNYIEENGAMSLAALKNLISLNVEWNNIRHAGASSLTTLTNLTSLNIRSNVIGKIGAQSLASLTSLTSLKIGSNYIEEIGASSLVSLTNLTSLDILSNNFKMAAQVELRQKLTRICKDF